MSTRKTEISDGQLFLDFDNTELKRNSELYTPELQEGLRKLCNVQARKTNGAISADDLLGVCHMCVVKQFNKFNASKSTFTIWAMQKSRWAIKDYFRSLDHLSRRDRKAVRDTSSGGSCPCTSLENVGVDSLDISHTEDHESGELLSVINGCINNLSRPIQDVIRMKYIEDIPYMHMSKKLGISVQKIKRLESTGIIQLRSKLKDINGRGLLFPVKGAQ